MISFLARFVTLRKTALILIALIFAAAPAVVLLADEPPADRQAIPAPKAEGEKEAPLLLPSLPDADLDAGNRDWSRSDAATIIREAHLRRVTAAFGLAGTLTGMSLTSLLIAAGQTDPAISRGWRYAAATTASLAGVSLIVGTALWATTPPAPGHPRLAVGPEPGIGLTLTFF